LTSIKKLISVKKTDQTKNPNTCNHTYKIQKAAWKGKIEAVNVQNKSDKIHPKQQVWYRSVIFVDKKQVNSYKLMACISFSYGMVFLWQP